MNGEKFRIKLHPVDDREAIYRLRYKIYSAELHQHQPNEQNRLTDKLDTFNFYIGIHMGPDLVGFVSITPPGHDSYSVDKYVTRDQVPFKFHDGLYEIRILAVEHAWRNSAAAMLLMYAAYRQIQYLGGTHIMAMGRVEVLDIYLKLGMRPVGCRIESGEVSFELMHAEVASLEGLANVRFHPLIAQLRQRCIWQLAFPF